MQTGITYMNTTQAAQEIRSFIEENYLYGCSDSLKDSDSFLDVGILDSTGILQLIEFLGERFRITVTDEEVTPQNLDSIDKIVVYLQRKGGIAAGGDGTADRTRGVEASS